jgi:hypothetical protein
MAQMFASRCVLVPSAFATATVCAFPPQSPSKNVSRVPPAVRSGEKEKALIRTVFEDPLSALE